MASVMTVTETDRLRLREFARSDLDALAEMVGDRDQMSFYPRPRTRDEAGAWLDRNLKLYEAPGFGFWLVESRRGAGFLGYCGIRPLELRGASEIELGWHIKKECWNRGVATEAATATLGLAFGRLALSRLVALIHTHHGASRRVAEKLGMTPGVETVVDGFPCVVYEIDAPRSPSG